MPFSTEVLWHSYRLIVKMSFLYGGGVSCLKFCLHLLSTLNSGVRHFRVVALQVGGKSKGYWDASKEAVMVLCCRWMDYYYGRYISLDAGKREVSSDEPPANAALVPFPKNLICHG